MKNGPFKQHSFIIYCNHNVCGVGSRQICAIIAFNLFRLLSIPRSHSLSCYIGFPQVLIYRLIVSKYLTSFIFFLSLTLRSWVTFCSLSLSSLRWSKRERKSEKKALIKCRSIHEYIDIRCVIAPKQNCRQMTTNIC